MIRRYHMAENTLQKAVAIAIQDAKILKRAGVHTLRHYAERRTMPRISFMWAPETEAIALLA